jgi:hypothetical protein
MTVPSALTPSTARNSHVGAIIGGVIGGLVAVGAVIGVIAFLLMQRARNVLPVFATTPTQAPGES